MIFEPTPIVTSTVPASSVRQHEIVNRYLKELDLHIHELKAGNAERTFEIKDFADMLHIHPGHLSNTVHEVLKQSPCDLYEQRLLNAAKELLRDPSFSIGQIAQRLTYDPSNFTKFFKRFEGVTPKQFRQAQLSNGKF